MFKRFLRIFGFRGDRFRLQREWRVTRLDRLDIYVDALMEIHPELKNHPKVIDFRECHEAYKKELEMSDSFQFTE